MNFEIGNLQAYIEDYYNQKHPEFIITARIRERISAVIMNNKNIGNVPKELLEKEITDFLERNNTLKFVKERQPELSLIPIDVVDHVCEYFKQELKNYKVLSVYRKSNYPNDSFIYSVLAQHKNGEYACWTIWNESIQSLNHGHMGIPTMENAMRILKENFNDITGDLEKYGLERYCVEVSAPEQITESSQEPEQIIWQRPHAHR
jgi:hypothetical protein